MMHTCDGLQLLQSQTVKLGHIRGAVRFIWRCVACCCASMSGSRVSGEAAPCVLRRYVDEQRWTRMNGVPSRTCCLLQTGTDELEIGGEQDVAV